VSKSPVHHRDEWLLYNLRRLRRLLYPDAGLAELLQASPDVEAGDALTLYREAVATLEDYALGLRSRPEPEIQAEVARIDKALAGVKRALDDPYTPLDETALMLALEGGRRPDLTEDAAAEIEQLVDQLIQPCRQCHKIEHATIVRVQNDQDVLERAEFNHRAHILQVRCLDCHAEIPIARGLEGEVKSAESAIDRAAIENLPRIERCQECHRPGVSSNRCVTCHEFHPDKSRRSNLLLYMTAEDLAAQAPAAAAGEVAE